MDNIRDVSTVVSDLSGLTFANRKIWQRLCSDELSALIGYRIIDTIITVSADYFLCQNMDAFKWRTNGNDFKLLKVEPNEETGKVDFHVINLDADEARQIHDNPIALWH